VTPEIVDKVRIVRLLSAQIAPLMVNKRTPTQARMLQQLKQRRAELSATLPPLRLVKQENT
jgi:hypothetical protein